MQMIASMYTSALAKLIYRPLQQVGPATTSEIADNCTMIFSIQNQSKSTLLIMITFHYQNLVPTSRAFRHKSQILMHMHCERCMAALSALPNPA